MSKEEVLKELENLLDAANKEATEIAVKKMGDISMLSTLRENYIQGRIDTLAQAIRYVKEII